MALRKTLDVRAARLMASALISSGLTTSELRLVAQSLRASSLSHTIGLLVEDFCFNLDPEGFHRKQRSDSLAKDLLAAIRKKKMSRDLVVRRMLELSGLTHHELTTQGQSMEAIVKSFLQGASDEEVNEFRLSLQGGSGEDSYLKGITNR